MALRRLQEQAQRKETTRNKDQLSRMARTAAPPHTPVQTTQRLHRAGQPSLIKKDLHQTQHGFDDSQDHLALGAVRARRHQALKMVCLGRDGPSYTMKMSSIVIPPSCHWFARALGSCSRGDGCDSSTFDPTRRSRCLSIRRRTCANCLWPTAWVGRESACGHVVGP